MPAGEEFNRRLMIYYSRINILLSAIDHNARNSIFRMNRIKKQLAMEYTDCVSRSRSEYMEYADCVSVTATQLPYSIDFLTVTIALLNIWM